MKLAVLVGVAVVAAASGSFAQEPKLTLEPVRITVKIVDSHIGDAIDMVGRVAGFTVEWDAGVSLEVRSQTVPVVTFVNAPADRALTFLTGQAGLTYVVVDAKTVRIQTAQK